MPEVRKLHCLAELRLYWRAKYAFGRSGDFVKLFARPYGYVFSLNEGQCDLLKSRWLKCSSCLARQPRDGFIPVDSHSLKLWTRHYWLC